MFKLKNIFNKHSLKSSAANFIDLVSFSMCPLLAILETGR